MARTLNFRSKEAYRKWLAYGHIHLKGKFGRKPHSRIYIRGRLHKPKHKG